MPLSYVVLGVSACFAVAAAMLYVWTAQAIRSDFESV
jgi:hypothetical protein